MSSIIAVTLAPARSTGVPEKTGIQRREDWVPVFAEMADYHAD